MYVVKDTVVLMGVHGQNAATTTITITQLQLVLVVLLLLVLLLLSLHHLLSILQLQIIH